MGMHQTLHDLHGTQLLSRSLVSRAAHEFQRNRMTGFVLRLPDFAATADAKKTDQPVAGVQCRVNP